MAREGFNEIIAQAKNDIAACKKQLGQHGNLPPIVMAMDFNNNHNYTQKQEVVVQPRNPLGEQKPTSALLEKYMNLIEDEPKLPEPVIEVDPIEEEENDID